MQMQDLSWLNDIDEFRVVTVSKQRIGRYGQRENENESNESIVVRQDGIIMS
jgi:hypothetical protein